MIRTITIALFAGIACLALGQQNPPQWSSASSYIAGTLVRGSDGNYYRATHNSTNHNPIADNHSYWELYYVRASVVLPVAMSGARFTSIKQAWNFLTGATMGGPTTIDIRISSQNAAYLESMSGPFSLNHAYGSQITITGDNALKVTVQFPTLQNGFTVTSGHRFGGLNGLTINGTDSANSFAVGLLASEGGVIGSSKVSVVNFGVGIEALRKSQITCDQSNVKSCGTGYEAMELSNIDCSQGLATSCTVGFDAEIGSTLSCDHASTYSCGTGYSAVGNSTMYATAAKADHGAYGFYSQNHSVLETGASSSTYMATGYYASYGSSITASSNITGNNTQDYNITVNKLSPDGSFISHS